MRVSQNAHAELVRQSLVTRNKHRKAGKVETIYGNLRFMSVATIRKMNKASLDDWLFQRGDSCQRHLTITKKSAKY